MAMNQKISALPNPMVWKALRYLIDYGGIANSIGRGQISPSGRLVPGHVVLPVRRE
jgi:hypothetical protein